MTYASRIEQQSEQPGGGVAPRVTQHGRVLQLVGERGVEPLVVYDITAGAIAGQTDLVVRSGDRVSVVFEEQQQHAATVRWVRAALTGLSFARPLPLVLLQGRQTSRVIPREPRYDISRRATIHRNGAVCQGVIRNVSRNGMLIDSAPGLLPGCEVRIECGAVRTLLGIVRWVHHGQAGLRLTEPIDPEAFEATTAEAALRKR